jgi:hypothetical protein
MNEDKTRQPKVPNVMSGLCLLLVGCLSPMIADGEVEVCAMPRRAVKL